MKKQTGDEGFMMAAMIVAIFLVLLALTVAAPRIAAGLKRDREVESVHRANQYVRGIRMYYKKFGHYPGSVEQLEKSNNQRFLRQKYVDPLTGKDDWRLIHQGENKTKVKGFFGEDLPGLGGGLGTGLGSAQGLQSGGGSGSAFNNSGVGGNGQNGSGDGGAGGSGSGSGIGGTSTGGFGSGANSGTGSTGSSVGSGISSQNAGDAKGTGGPIIGVGSSKSGAAEVVVNEQASYQDWEFLYDPRIEQLYAKGNLLGGGPSTGGTGNGFGTPIGAPATPAPGTTTAPPNPTPQP